MSKPDSTYKDFDAVVRAAMAGACGVAARSRVVVAVSGGADSVALLASLVSAGYECVAAHCNFHLRGAESQRDMHFVERLTDAIGVDLYIKNFNVTGECERTGESVEMACRRLRYAWFHDLLERLRASAIAVAHHRDDQAETFLLNTLRGTGIAGLCGMAPRNGLVVRPMLGVSRKRVEEYLSERGLEYITDSTNLQNDYRRNRMRNLVLPVMEQAEPGATEAITRTMSLVRSGKALYDWAVETVRRTYADADMSSIRLADMAAEMPAQAARTALFELLRHRGFTATQTDNMLRAAETMLSGTTTFHTEAYRAEIKDGVLEIMAAGEGTPAVQEVSVSLKSTVMSPVRIDVSLHHISEFKPERDTRTIYLDAEVVDGNPDIVLRHWRQGDRMRPFGMKGEKLVSDIFADAHLTAARKRDTWLLVRNGVILWVVGVRASAHFAVSPATRRYLRLTLNH